MHAVSLALTVSMATCGWGGAHGVMRQLALQSLPDWQQELLGEAGTRLCGDYLSLQDQHAGGQRPDLDPYCVVPGVALSLHDVNPVPATTGGMRFYLGHTRDAVQEGEMDEAARYLGVLCHWLEDPSSPTMHCVEGFIDEARLRELIPPPDDLRGRHYLYGYAGIGDNGRYEMPAEFAHTPVLLGRTIDEAAFHLQRRQRLNARMARQSLVPLVWDEMHGDGAEAARIRGELMAAQTRTTADAIFTALCLASDRVEGDTTHLDAVPLTDFASDYHGGSTTMPYRWVPFLIDAAFDQQRNVVPLELAGPHGPVQFERGIGMGVPFGLDWSFGPAGVMSRLSATVGLSPHSVEGASATFAVLVNGEEAVCVGPLAAGEARQIDVPLPTDGPAVELRLETRVAPAVPGEGCLAVWGEPTLHR